MQGVQNEYCFPLLSMHIFSVVVDVVMVVAYAPFYFSQACVACTLTSHAIFRETSVSAFTELPYLVSLVEPFAISEVLWPAESSFVVPVANPVGIFPIRATVNFPI